MRATDLNFSLWGLTRDTTSDPELPQTLQTFIIRLREETGVLIFASALDAEIYSQHLAACGMSGWQRRRLERIDLDAVMASVPQQQRRLMLALGFFASDTNDLLLDDNQSLVTPLLPIEFEMRHRLHGMSQLFIHADVLAFVHHWWERIGGTDYSEQVFALENWSDIALACCANDALEKVQVMEMRDYKQTWTLAGMVEECAVYAPASGTWQFAPLGGTTARQLH